MIKRRFFVYALALLVASPFFGPRRADAIIPLLLELAAPAAELAIGQWAAAGLARVINPTTKTLEIPNPNKKVMRISFLAASAAVAGVLALLAKKTGHTSLSGNCSPGGFYPNSPPATLSLASAESLYSSHFAARGLSPTFSKITAAGNLGFTASFADGSFDQYAISCGSSTSAADVTWLDLSNNPTQAKTDSLVSAVKSLAPAQRAALGVKVFFF